MPNTPRFAALFSANRNQIHSALQKGNAVGITANAVARKWSSGIDITLATLVEKMCPLELDRSSIARFRNTILHGTSVSDRLEYWR